MKVVNLTPHSVNVQDLPVIRSSGVARVESEIIQTDTINGIPVLDNRNYIRGLPKQKEDTIYIVSEITAKSAPHRTDLYVPFDSIKNKYGKIVGCRGIKRYSPIKEEKREEKVESKKKEVSISREDIMKTPQALHEYLGVEVGEQFIVNKDDELFIVYVNKAGRLSDKSRHAVDNLLISLIFGEASYRTINGKDWVTLGFIKNGESNEGS